MTKMFEKEAALFMPTGTMANLSAGNINCLYQKASLLCIQLIQWFKVMAHCNERGCEVIIGDKSHFNLWEQGGICQVTNISKLTQIAVFVKQNSLIKDCSCIRQTGRELARWYIRHRAAGANGVGRERFALLPHQACLH